MWMLSGLKRGFAVARSIPVTQSFRHAPRCRSIRQSHSGADADLKSMLPTLQDLGLNNGDSVTVAMSGGVDSSLTLRLLAELPLNLDAVFMRNWDPLLSEDLADGPVSLSYSSASGETKPAHQCQWERDFADVKAVAKHVGLREDQVRLVDFSKEYWSKVFEPAVGVWEGGGTPNPDVDCNREIKFGALMDCLPGGDERYLATGHYAKVKRSGARASLHRAKDMGKDQTYYLSQVPERQLQRAVFPLADIPKSSVRKLAQYFRLPTADREESMGVCFIGERGRFGDFISQYTAPPQIEGHLVTLDGTRLASHLGIWYYTIGQRARVPGMADRWFVAKKGVGESGQDILVVPGADHPILSINGVTTSEFHWIAGAPPNDVLESEGKEYLIQVRHRMTPVRAIIKHSPNSSTLEVTFRDPVSAVAPGQVLAVWDGDQCLGSGVISSTRSIWDAAHQVEPSIREDSPQKTISV